MQKIRIGSHMNTLKCIEWQRAAVLPYNIDASPSDSFPENITALSEPAVNPQILWQVHTACYPGLQLQKLRQTTVMSFTQSHSESMLGFFKNSWKSSTNISTVSRQQVWKEMSGGIAQALPKKRNPCRIPQECRKTLQLFPIFFLLSWWLLIFMKFTFHLSFL